MFEYKKEWLDGFRFKVEYDPTDKQFQIITIRFVRNYEASPAQPDTPLCNIVGEQARSRFIRYVLGSAAGFLSADGAPPKAIKAILKVRSKFEDADN